MELPVLYLTERENEHASVSQEGWGGGGDSDGRRELLPRENCCRRVNAREEDQLLVGAGLHSYCKEKGGWVVNRWRSALDMKLGEGSWMQQKI